MNNWCGPWETANRIVNGQDYRKSMKQKQLQIGRATTECKQDQWQKRKLGETAM